MSAVPDWLDLSDDGHAAAEAIGNAGPTLRIEDRTLKGYCLDDDGSAGKAYHSSDDLRRYAKGLAEIADWLEARKAEAA
jgi:hypothetical protein